MVRTVRSLKVTSWSIRLAYGFTLVLMYGIFTRRKYIHVEYLSQNALNPEANVTSYVTAVTSPPPVVVYNYTKLINASLPSALVKPEMELFTPADDLDCLFAKMPLAGRLGNELFLYASLWGLGTKYHRKILYNHKSTLFSMFRISAEPYEYKLTGFTIKRERSANKFDVSIIKFLESNHGHLLLNGYFQSFHYFDRLKESLRKELTFVDSVQQEVTAFLLTSAMDAFGVTNSTEMSQVIFIGVHIRRGDMTTAYSHKRGYIEASSQYISNAVTYFQEILAKDRILFVVVSDDMKWSKPNFDPKGSHVVFSPYAHWPAHDLAILASCNHTLMTVGSFGWWGAYLAGGKTVYYKDFPTPGTYISGLFNKLDYFHHSWVGLR